MKKTVDYNIKCPKCGAQQFIADTVFSSGVVLRCACCSSNGKPTYIKNVNNDVFQSLQSRGLVHSEPVYASQVPYGSSSPLGTEPWQQAVISPSITAQAPSSPVTDVHNQQEVSFADCECSCCSPTMFGTGFDAFGLPCENQGLSLRIIDDKLWIQHITAGQPVMDIGNIPVQFCPVCGKKVKW